MGASGEDLPRTVDLDGVEEVITMRLDLEYWPSSELRRTADGWERTAISTPQTANDGVEPVFERSPAANP